MKNNPLFAIVDIETTGFSPKRGDKILEISIVTSDMDGQIIESYETLINPLREVSASHIHGITAEMVKNAPLIEDVIDEIIYHLNNKTIVGHNINFDLNFINYEIERLIGNQNSLNGICTLQLSKQIFPDLPVRKLESLCEYFDIENQNSHSAYSDCVSTVKLFNILKSQLITSIGINEFYSDYLNPISFQKEFCQKDISFKRSDAIEFKKEEKSRLAIMLSRIPTNPTDSVPVQNYLILLDEILADRIITESETNALFDFILDHKISQKQVSEIHNEYLKKLVRVYLLDNILSKSELNDLEKVRELLCVNKNELDNIIIEQKEIIQKQNNQNVVQNNSEYIGKSVCFTGELISKYEGALIDRTKAEQIAMERGLILKSGVSKKLDYLVTADPNSLSGKARKARDYGVKILAEPVFWNMLGVNIE